MCRRTALYGECFRLSYAFIPVSLAEYYSALYLVFDVAVSAESSALRRITVSVCRSRIFVGTRRPSVIIVSDLYVDRHSGSYTTDRS